MAVHNTTTAAPTALLGRRTGCRRVIARACQTVAAGALWALVATACSAAGYSDVPPLRSNGNFIHVTDTGSYVTTGAIRSGGCTWNLFDDPPADVERSFAFTDWADFQLARGDVAVGQAAQVEVSAGQYFLSSGCADWHPV